LALPPIVKVPDFAALVMAISRLMAKPEMGPNLY
jgi:hypothetical protein